MSQYVKEIFVFGSNLAGIHGAGSALEAKKNHGAIQGKGVGYAGHSYALPTKNKDLKVISLGVIHAHILDFFRFARENPEWRFNIVDIGCGLAGYTPEQIAPLFKGAPSNCVFLGKLNDLVQR